MTGAGTSRSAPVIPNLVGTLALGSVPILETERLRLRCPRAEDLEPQAAMLADPAVMRHVGGQPMSREETWRKLLSVPGAWGLLGYGYWTVERREDGRYLGQLGFADFKRDIVPSLEGLPEMGWMFAVHAHGKGYASEGVGAALSWLDAFLQPQEVVAIIDPANRSSIAVALKAGFREAEHSRYKGEPTVIFRRGRPAESSASAAT